MNIINPIDYLYNYRILKYRVYDGDGIKDVLLDEGRHELEGDVDVRLYGIDCPETRRSKSKNIGDLHVLAGKLITKYLEDFLNNHELIWIKSHKKANAKYDRLIATLFAGNINVNLHLLEKGFAKPYLGKTKQIWTDDELNIIIKELQ